MTIVIVAALVDMEPQVLVKGIPKLFPDISSCFCISCLVFLKKFPPLQSTEVTFSRLEELFHLIHKNKHKK